LLGWGTNAENNCNNFQLLSQAPFLLLTVGGSGGVSNCTSSSSQNLSSCSGGYTKPPWQVAPGVPADSKRDLPDVSLFASNGFSGNFYIFCESDAFGSCNTFNFGAAGGTSFGAPAFAGIMALVNQQMQMPQGQGNANYVLYKLAGQQTASACNSTTGPGANCVFNDVTSGTIAMPCLAGSLNCTVQTPGHSYGVLSGYSTGPGYDLATGLGTINVANLVNKWNTVVFRPSATTLTLSPTINITHGQAVTVNASVSPSTGSGTPSGNMSLLTSTGVGIDGFTLSGGAVSGTTNLLPGGSYTVAAHYAGDSTFGGSDSTPVQVTVGKENSSAQIELITFDWQGRLISNNASTAVYGSPYILRVDVFNSLGSACQPNPLGESGCPTGNVTLTDNSSPLDGGTFGLNSLGYTEDQLVQLPGGNNSVKAQYAGDNSFNASSATNVLTITPASTNSNVCCPFTNFTVGQNAGASANVNSLSSGVAPTGTITFLDNGKVLPGTPTYSNPGGAQLNATLGFVFSTSGPHNITAAYSGDKNYASSVSGPMSDYAYYPTTTGLNISTTSPLANGTVTLTALVDTPANLPVAGSVVFSYTPRFVGTPAPIPGTPTVTHTTDAQGNSALQAVLTFVPSSNLENVFATFAGDSNYQLSTSNGFTIAVAGNDFILDMNTAPLIMPAGSSGVTGFEIDAEAGYSGTATFKAGTLPAETIVTFTPTSVTGSGQVSVQISTIAPHSTANGRAGKGMPSISAFATLLPVVGLLLFGGRRHRNSSVLLLVLFCSMLGATSCGGGTGGGGGGGGFTDPGTPKGSYKITVTVTSDTGISHTGTLPLVIQ
jgi:hypothetical protein